MRLALGCTCRTRGRAAYSRWLLNRIGQNIVVFDYVRPPTMKLILERKVLPSIRKQIYDRWKLDVDFTAHVVDQLMESAVGDVQSGGRGIGNLVEAAILNPLSRVTFEMMVQSRELVHGARSC